MLPFDERSVLKQLSIDPSIFVTRAYKEHATVIMGRNKYITKALEHLQDQSTYTSVNNISTIQRKLNEKIKDYGKK